jgi:hypothetical protein
MSEHLKETQSAEHALMNGLPEPPFPLVTPLAQQLWALRQKIVASGRPLLDWDDIEREIAEQRGVPSVGERC